MKALHRAGYCRTRSARYGEPTVGMKSAVVDPAAYENELLRRAEIDWHGVTLGQPDWGEDSHSLACTIRSGPHHVPFVLHLMFNAYWEALDFELPAVPETAVIGCWQRWIDTALESPEDIVESAAAPLVPGTHYRVMPRSVAALSLRIGTSSGDSLKTHDVAAGR